MTVEKKADDPFGGAAEVSPVDLNPVDLDPPSPAIARWEELADRDICVQHNGNAEMVIPFPRPAWADPDEDVVGDTVQSSIYRSPVAYVASMTGGGDDDGNTVRPANFQVSAKIHGSGQMLIGVTINAVRDGKWCWLGISIDPKGALDLSEVLRAAVELVGGGH